MKKLCFVINQIGWGGGTERVGIRIINGLADKGYDITLVALWQSEESAFFPLDERVRFISLFEHKRSLYKHYFQLVKALRRVVKEHRIDTIINIETTLALMVAPAVWGLKTRHVSWEHYNFLASADSAIRPLARYVAAWCADNVVTLTERDASLWRKRARPRARVVTINNPMPFEEQHPYNFHRDSRTVLTVGRLNRQKGYDMLLDAWQQTRGQTSPEWKLQIVGSGEEETSLKERARALGIEQSVEFHPHTREIEPFYRNAAMYCMSSRYEGLPMVLIEASSYGLPMVSFDCVSGPSEIIEHDRNGLLARDGDPADLATRLCEMMNDDDRRVRCSQAAYQMTERFRPETILSQWEALLRGESIPAPPLYSAH
ncbi:glycosyltransferase involved in cell wall biosynthesis [Kushneria sinocarnis]|uniref:Glycosyltransferase involved in cell wall biosynthesis n=1 Tax=Kushneria sinocarnis TaxID=595502 RepID=A0A420WVY7_9GAMM|nr:glycosyltransferase family 4 protein [Kushneria sinocarnis]RKR03252.1 glycosyltransferase involved in cell wall biosynthesis [Kushneria sinocarnis]